MGMWSRLFGAGGSASSAPLEDQIAEYIAGRLELLDIWQLPTVVAGRQLTADVAAGLPMVATSGARRVRPTPPLLRRPDPREPYRRTIERICNSLTRHGGCWFRIYNRDATGWPVAIRVLDYDRVSYELSVPGDEIARVWVDGVLAERRDIGYIPFRCDDGPIGTAPIGDTYDTLDQLVLAYRFGADYYSRDAAVPPYALKHNQRYTSTQSDEFMAQWETARARRRPAFLSGGVELETFTPQTAADAMLLESIEYLDAIAARVQQIPPSLLNVTAHSSLTYSTTLDELRRWLTLGLAPGMLARIEAAFTDLLPRGQTAVFDTSNLLRMDFAGRIATLADSIAAGIHTTDEARVLEGLPVTPAAEPVPIAPNIEGL